MKKYRIVKLETEEYTTYCIQKRFLFFWWIDLTSNGGYSDWDSTTHYYETLDDARTALRRFHVKKTVIEEL